MLKKAVFFFCNDIIKDHVAPHVYKACHRIFDLKESDRKIDSHSVYTFIYEGNEFHFVSTTEVLSHNYTKYLPILNEHYSDFDFAGIVNWHEGANAPMKIFCVHTTGDVPSGKYGQAHPLYMRNLIVALEKYRLAAGLNDFSVITEATHWSGIPYGGNPEQILEFPVPLVDIEIGSSIDDWRNSDAAEVIGHSLAEIFNSEQQVISILCVGGVHFDSSFAEIELDKERECPIAVSHILANQWVVSGEYDNNNGALKLMSCIKSIEGGINGIVFHDNLKGCYKQQLREIAEKLNIPVMKHKKLKNPLLLDI